MYHLCIVLLFTIILYVDGSIIQILPNPRTNSNDFIQSQKFFRKFQEPTTFTISGASNVYAKVTGLTLAFNHAYPLLYKIKFDAICFSPKVNTWVFPRIMVNEVLIYNDKLIQNKEDRYNSIPGFTDVHMFDHIGVGQYAFFAPMAMAITKSEWIYLQPGLHVIDAVVRAIGEMPVHIYYGVLSIELIEFKMEANIGDMIPINVTLLNPNV